MLILLSPAKTLDFTTPAPTSLMSEPDFLSEAQILVKIMRDFDAADLGALMSVSEKIASLNVERFNIWQKATSTPKGKQALYAFLGDVYIGLDASKLKAREQATAQKQLRILSGLYGVLRPMDIIMPYRLEMGTRLKNPAGVNLYDYWQTKVTQTLNRDITQVEASFVLNLASNEYFKAVLAPSLIVPVLSPEFKDYKNGQYKVISFYAKKARGLMARFCLQHAILSPEGLQAFNLNGYYYNAKESTRLKPVFFRDHE